MATKKAKDKAVKKVAKAVRKALKKGVDESTVEQAVEIGMDRPKKRKASPPKKGPQGVKLVSSSAPQKLRKLADEA